MAIEHDLTQIATGPVAVFGNGDLMVTSGSADRDEQWAALLIYPAEGPGPIGAAKNNGRSDEAMRICPKGATTANKPAAMALVFHTVESIDVVLETLREARESLAPADAKGGER